MMNSLGGLRRSCSMSLRYCAEIASPSSLRILVARSFWLMPSFLRAAEMTCPNVSIGDPLISGPQVGAQCQRERVIRLSHSLHDTPSRVRHLSVLLTDSG